MAVLRVTGFQGVVQAAHPLTLPDTVGAAGLNMRPGFGDLRPWQQPSAIALAANTVVGGAISLYRYNVDTPSDTLYWLTWPYDVDVARGLVGNDPSERTYYTDGTLPKWIDNTFGLAGVPYPTNARTLGVPAPSAAPTVAVTGGSSSSLEARVYVWTWVTDKGEESAPSLPSTVTSLYPVDATWTVTLVGGPPTYAGSFASRNIYRSATTSTGSATYLYVGSTTNLAGGATYADTVPDTSLGAALQSTNWAMPPANMIGLTAMWMGMMAGFFSKTLCFSVPFVPYAWPVPYQLVIPETIVGLCIWQQNLMVLTDGRPYVATGTDPTTLQLVPIDASYSCSAKRSICAIPGGCVWAAPDGLAYSGTRGSDIVSDLVFTREQWQALNPASMIIKPWGSFLVVRYNNGTDGCLVFDWEKANAVYPNKLKIKEVYPSNIAFDAAYHDPLSGELYLLNTAGQSIAKWNAGSSPATVVFTSKQYRQPGPVLFLWGQIQADTYPVSLSLTVDGIARLTSFSVASAEPFKLPIAGFKGRDWQVVVSATGPVQEVLLTTSIKELQSTV